MRQHMEAFGQLARATRVAAFGAAIFSIPGELRAAEGYSRPAAAGDAATREITTRVERVAPAGRRAVLKGWEGPTQNLRWTDLQGRDLSSVLSPRVENGELAVELPTRQFVIKPAQIQTLVVRSNEQMMLPGGVVQPVMAEGASQPSSLAWFRLTLAASPVPALWDAAQGNYLTRLTFGLRRPDNAPASIALEQPVIVKLSFVGLTGAEPAPLTIDAPGLEHEKTVDLHFLPSTQEPKLLVRSSISDADLALAALPRLDVRPVQRAMLGFGLETVAVTVEQVMPHGLPFPAGETTPVVLQIDGRARPDPPQPEIASGASTASFALRSAGLGAVTIRANAGGRGGVAVIEQQFPTGPLVAAVVGGVLGGFLRRFVKGAKRAGAGRRVLEGALVGVVAFVAGVLGVGLLDLPSAIVGTEAGAFLTGTIIGFVGVTAMEMLAKARVPRGAE